MIRSRFARRRVGTLLAVLAPGLILVYSLGSADAQFPKQPGIPNPPFGPNMPGGPFGPNRPGGPFGPNRPGNPFGPMGPGGGLGPKKIVYDWRCSKCGTIVATTTSPFSPGVGSCPNCNVRFINGGSNFLRPPTNLPPANPPGNMPPGNVPPQAGMPPGNMPPVNPPPGNMPPVNMPPANAPADPVVAPPADPGALGPPVAAPGLCRWCSGDVSPGNRYCWRCKLMAGGAMVGGTLVLVVAVAVCAVLVFVFMRSGGR